MNKFVDPTDPIPTITRVVATPNPAKIGQEVMIEVESIDNDGTIEEMEITVDGVLITGTTWTATTEGEHTISVIVIDNDGNRSTAVETKVTVTDPNTGGNGVITVNSPTDGTSINNPGPITFDIDVTAEVAEVWYIVRVAGESPTIYVVDNADSDFDYTWRPREENIGQNSIEIIAKDANGKVLESKTIDLTLTGEPDYEVGINDAVYINEISIYPMPASSHATVAVTALTAGSVVVEILDMNGNVVLIENGYISSNDVFEVNFSVENLDSGVYLTRVTLNGESVTKKLVVQ